jgi:hypothetical protein
MDDLRMRATTGTRNERGREEHAMAVPHRREKAGESREITLAAASVALTTARSSAVASGKAGIASSTALWTCRGDGR